MFAGTVQPGIVSLFSSTGSDPLQLFSTKTDTSLPSDSFVCLLDDATSSPAPPPPTALIFPTSKDQENSERDREGYALKQTVLHIQSPTLRTTFIRSPPDNVSQGLGLKLPWLHIQARNLQKGWSFEIGIVDRAGRSGIVRCSTFQREPRLYLNTTLPLLHLPLSFPSESSQPLTSWTVINLYLPSLLPNFSSASLMATHNEGGEDPPLVMISNIPVPSGVYSHVTYVKVYATCRLRRIWFSEAGPKQTWPWEFQLYADN